MVIPLILLVRILRPIILIRFGRICAFVIGHFVFDTEYYLTEKKIEKIKSLDLFYFDYKYKNLKNNPLNTQWHKMISRHLLVHPFISYLDIANKMIPGNRTHRIVMPIEKKISFGRDVKGLLSLSDPVIRFTKDENNQGKLHLESIGLNQDDKFVCLIVRDSAYKEKYCNWKDDWSYHDYRNSDIDTYEDAALALAEKGYWVLRMGKVVNKPFKVKHTRVFDYANSEYRSDFLDIWLSTNCSFSLMTNTGIGDLVCVFRRPVAFVNALPLGYINTSSNSNSIWLPKKIVWKDNKKQLTLKEQIETGVIGFLGSEYYKNASVELIDNTPGEITEIILELEEKITGKWQPHPQDDELQNKFWEILQTWEHFPKLHGELQSRIPDFWIRQNHKWFLA